MKTSKHIDWLSITIANSVNWRNFLPFTDLYLQGKGRHGYGQAWIDRRTGARIETASTRDEMGTHLTLSGDVLSAMRDDLGMIDDALISRIQEYDGKCSRIDMAIDCKHATFTPDMLNVAIMDGSARLRARTWRYIDGHKNGIQGSTVDTGSTSSDKRFRFYDKRAEQGIKDGEEWVRLELQLRRQYATSTLVSCGQYGVEKTVVSAIASYLTWDNTEYHAVMTGDYLPVSTTPRREANRKKWLLGQVARALASECHVDPKFRERFDLSVNHFIEQLDNPNK